MKLEPTSGARLGAPPLLPFQIDVHRSVLADLQHRLRSAQFIRQERPTRWQGGTDVDYLGELARYWSNDFDWWAAQSRLNTYKHFRASIDGVMMHAVHLPSAGAPGANPIPIMLCHGWPSCFVEQLELAERLSDPARFGADPADAFDVVIPSLPGFGYSGLPNAPLTRARMAELAHGLMHDAFGYSRYATFGGDIGGGVATWLGSLHAEAVLGVHLIHPPRGVLHDQASLSPAEQQFIDAEAAYDALDEGYSSIMQTRPDTIASALIDSPVGLAAWIVDKFRDWADCNGDLEARINRDTLLTIITLYWVTGTIRSSFQSYFDYSYNPPHPPITVPVGVTLSAEPSERDFPRSLIERVCSDVRFWNEPKRGGHFMPLEEPDLLARDIRSFYRLCAAR